MASPAEALHVPEPEGEARPEDRLHVAQQETDPIAASRARREEALAIADARHAERMADVESLKQDSDHTREGIELLGRVLEEFDRRLSAVEEHRAADAWYAEGEQAATKATGEGGLTLPPLDVRNPEQVRQWAARFLGRKSAPGAASRAAGNA